MENSLVQFKQSWWCPGAHAQTLYAALFRKAPKIQTRRKQIETPDQDFFEIDICDVKKGAPRVLILHGLSSSSDAAYVRSLMGCLGRHDFNSIAMNYRGCTELMNRRKTTYHSGKTDDLNTLVEWTQKHYANEELHLVGFSIGGNIALKWLGELRERLPANLKRCVAISVPFNLKTSVELLDQGFSKNIYTRNLITQLKKKTNQKLQQYPNLVSRAQLDACQTFTEFDNLVTAPLNGFRDAEDYWRQSSSGNYLQDIVCPTLLIHASDDPFFLGASVPKEKIEGNPALKLQMTSGGGHLGFISGNQPFVAGDWLEQRILRFLK